MDIWSITRLNLLVELVTCDILHFMVDKVSVNVKILFQKVSLTLATEIMYLVQVQHVQVQHVQVQHVQVQHVQVQHVQVHVLSNEV